MCIPAEPASQVAISLLKERFIHSVCIPAEPASQVAISLLKERFIHSAEALIHGDLHTGVNSVERHRMVRQRHMPSNHYKTILAFTTIQDAITVMAMVF